MNFFFDSLLGSDRTQHKFFSSFALSKIVNLAITLLLVCTFASLIQAQPPTKQWDKTFGRKDGDYLTCMIPILDGGFLLGGYTESNVSEPLPQIDFWIVKTDTAGNKLWDKLLGGNNVDVLLSMIQTSDGGFLLGGYSNSNQGGDKSQASRGGTDYWIIKIDAEGNKEWDKTLGGTRTDHLTKIIQATDGGYLVCGNSDSNLSGDKTQPSKGASDFWIVKINSTGDKEWDQSFGGSTQEGLNAACVSGDGGYLLGGSSGSAPGGDKSQASKGGVDYWIIKIDAEGNKEWDKTLGGKDFDNLLEAIPTDEGGYLLGGVSASSMNGDKTELRVGSGDYWIVKIDGLGNKEWDRTFGGRSEEVCTSILPTANGEYLLGGFSDSDLNGDKSEASRGGYDYWIVKISNKGIKIWDKTFGGNGGDYFADVALTIGGSYVLAGFSWSEISGDKSEPNQGVDYWLVKTTPDMSGNSPTGLQVNFQNKTTRTPQGWVKDYGLPFGEKTDQNIIYNYGWRNRSDGTPVDLSVGGIFPGNGRNRQAPTDVLLATLMHMQGNHIKDFRGTPVEAYWEVAVENGDYQVSVSVGDGMNYTSSDPESHSINVEGENAITNFIPQGSNGATTRFKQATVKVSVTDGFLTINADGGTNTKINYVRIQPLKKSSSLPSAQVSIEKTTQVHAKIYPNPFTNKLIIVAGKTGKVSVGLYDLMGNNYYKAIHQLESSNLELDLSSVPLKTGIYLIKLHEEDGTSQIIKMVKK